MTFIMMRRKVLAIVLAACSLLTVMPQTFTVTYDTVRVEHTALAKTEVVISRRGLCTTATDYYALLNYKEPMFGSMQPAGQAVVRIDKQTHEPRPVEVPRLPGFMGDFQNLMVRNDSVILKFLYYHDEEIFERQWIESTITEAETAEDSLETLEAIQSMTDYVYLPTAERWQKAGFADDAVWDDADFHVSVHEWGEWGYYVSFHSKHTLSNHIYQWHTGSKRSAGVVRRIFRQGGLFYIVGRYGVYLVAHPEQGREYDGRAFYEIEPCPDCYSVMDTLLTVQDKPVGDIITAFMTDGRMFLIMQNELQTYLAEIRDGQVLKRFDLAFNMSPQVGQGREMGMNCMPADRVRIYASSRVTDMSAWIEIDKTDIRITYFIIE